MFNNHYNKGFNKYYLWGHKGENYESWQGSDRRLYIWVFKDDTFFFFFKVKRRVFEGKEMTSSMAEIWMLWSDLNAKDHILA